MSLFQVRGSNCTHSPRNLTVRGTSWCLTISLRMPRNSGRSPSAMVRTIISVWPMPACWIIAEAVAVMPCSTSGASPADASETPVRSLASASR